MLRGVLFVVLLLSLCGVVGPACAASSTGGTLREELWLFTNDGYTTPGVSVDSPDPYEPLAPQCVKNGTFDRFMKSRLTTNRLPDRWHMPEPCRESQCYVEDLDNAFLYTHDDASPCGCPLVSFAKAYRKNDGSRLYLKHAYRYCAYTEESTASQPWADILPADFSENTFLAEGKSFPLAALNNFTVRVRVSRVDTRIWVSLRPLALGMYQPPMAGVRFETVPYSEQNTDLQFTAYLLTQGRAIMGKAMAEGIFTGISAADLDKARPLALAIPGAYEPENYTLERFHKESAQLYAEYSVYRRIAFSEIVMDWDSDKGRFYIVGKTPATPLSFEEFLNSMDFWFPYC